MRRLVGAVALALLLAWSVAPAAGAQDGPTTTVVPLPDQGPQRAPSIIPLPNSGHDPAYQGDTGSAAQYAVLGGIVVGLGVIVLLVRREGRRKRESATR